MRSILGLLLLGALILLGGLSSPAHAQQKKQPQKTLAERVKVSIDRGVKYLKESQQADGHWEVNLPTVGIKGGWSSLALLALLNAGVPPTDPVVKEGLNFLRKQTPTMTYVRALQTMVLVEAKQESDRQLIRENIDWLIKARVIRDGNLQGWTYGMGGAGTADNSNTQYALLGLWAGKQAGIEINREIWESIREYYLRTQEPDGGWNYASKGGPDGGGRASLTMTSAGLCGLLIAGMELNVGREKIQADGTAKECGVYDENQAAAKGLSWIGRNFIVNLPQRTFYHLYGLERTGRLSGLRFIGGHDWYREGCLWLVENQRDDGSFRAQAAWDQWPVVSTSFALLFMSKGRTPVLVSKLVHGDFPRNEADTDWNNDRNDLRHLVDFSSRSLFKNLPLAWQTFDIIRGLNPREGNAVTEEDEEDVTSELLQSPMLYFNGHKNPLRRFSALEKKILRRYIDNGGFILAEACCGSKAFDQGFKDLAAELWPDNDLDYLDGNHPLWTTYFKVTPGDPFKLMGVSMGCKTVVIYSPQDLSCLWESGNFKNGRAVKAFELGANIVAYATGREPPKPRLTQIEVASNKDDVRNIPRGFLKVAQIKHRGDWQPAPRAMRNLMDHLRKHFALDVTLKTEEIQIGSRGIIDFKFIYMHGRRDFNFDAADLDFLRFNLENGGLLFADACCGKEAFDKSFRKFMTQLFPKEKLVEVPQSDVIFSKRFNKEDLSADNIKCRREPGGPMRGVPPYLEGIKINDRWAVLYSKYDIGCALEKHQTPDCLGYSHESAQKLAGAAVLYTLTP